MVRRQRARRALRKARKKREDACQTRSQKKATIEILRALVEDTPDYAADEFDNSDYIERTVWLAVDAEEVSLAIASGRRRGT